MEAPTSPLCSIEAPVVLLIAEPLVIQAPVAPLLIIEAPVAPLIIELPFIEEPVYHCSS